MSQFSPIISVDELKNILPNVVILDARAGNNAKELYLEKHIKGARFIDLDNDLATHNPNPKNGGRHPLPDLFDFAKTLSELGIQEENQIVIYDDKGGANAAARCWWLLKSFGLKKVQVLNGGFQAAQDLEMNSGEEHIHQSTIKIPENWQLPTVQIQEVEDTLKTGKSIVIDVRDAYRYRGESEPIDPVAGHIPGAINIPLTENLVDNLLFLSPKKLQEKYGAFFSENTKEVIIHCGSGVTACHTILAMDYAGFPIPKLFVGSWSEWCRSEKEIAKEEN
jgi:thiosulfate/3-mercaptopyruvate sulfurtransferase